MTRRVHRRRLVPGDGSTRSTIVDPKLRAARVIVPDYQLSLAIGKRGQNARLAAKLTGWRIDIRDRTPTPQRRTARGPDPRPMGRGRSEGT
jgi:hypothetical protein